MKNPVDQTKQILSQFIEFISQSPWSGEYLDNLNQLNSQLDQPCVLAVAGRVKAGKSFFINALLGEDLAKTGTTETTATINIFKYGVPEDSSKPVCCIWSNGRRTWESKLFLDSLQGNDKDTLRRAEGISQLEFYIPNPILQDITLVDTPGTDAIVGENDDGHQKITEEYFRLRERHSKETKQLTDQADAVIYLIGQVANTSNQNFLQEFQNATGGNSSAMNAIGVMAKIDLADSIIEQRMELASSVAEKLQRELNTVIPISAGIWRTIENLQQNNQLASMQQQLCRIPEKVFEQMMQSDTMYFREPSILSKIFKLKNETDIPDIEKRRELKGDIPWRVFVVISKHLYYHLLDDAIQKLKDISGMDILKKLLAVHFFQRGKLLRCFRIVNQIRGILRDIEVNRIYELGREVKMKEKFEEFINSHPQNTKNRKIADELKNLINRTLKNEAEVNKISQTIKNQLIPIVEDLQLQLHKTDSMFHALQLLESTIDEFSTEERKELYSLFGMYGKESEQLNTETLSRRQQYWNIEYNLSRSSIRRKVAECAINCYGKN